MLQIALVAPAVAREGITKQVANQIKVLQQENIDVFLIVLTIYNAEVMAEFGVRLSNNNVLELQQPAPYLSAKALLKSYSTIRPILDFLKKNKVSIVVAHAAYAHFVMRLVKAITYLSRNTFTLYQYFHGLQYAQFPVNSLQRYAVNKLTQILAKLCDDGHVYISKATKEDVERNLVRIKKQLVIYNPIDIDQAMVVNEIIKNMFAEFTERFVIVLPGRLEHNKGQLFFLGMFEQFLHQQNLKLGEIIVLIAGKGESESELKDIIAGSNLRNYVRLVGELTNMDLRYMLHLAQLIVVPSFVEGLSFVALEGLAAGTTLLVSDAGGLKEVVKNGETGFVFRAGDEQDCLAKLRYLYQNRNNNLIDKARIEQDLRSRFSFEQYKRQLLPYLFHVTAV